MRVVGLVVDKSEWMMHGMELGTAGMHNQVRQWTTQGYMAQLLDLLLDHGFQVTITADHGNIEAVGFGRPTEGAVADLRGERVRIYPDIDFHRIICKIEQHVRRVSTDVIAYPQSVAIDSSPGVGFVFSDLYDVFFRELIVSIFNRHLFSMLCH